MPVHGGALPVQVVGDRDYHLLPLVDHDGLPGDVTVHTLGDLTVTVSDVRLEDLWNIDLICNIDIHINNIHIHTFLDR